MAINKITINIPKINHNFH